MATIDSLQDSVNTLTSSTTALLDEVNVSKATLIDSKDLAEAAASSATTQAAAAASSASAAASSASSASSSASAASASAASANAIVTGVATGMPSVRPSLNLDFVNSKVIDPRINFTRSTTATYYDGKTTAKAEENLVTWSEGIGEGGKGYSTSFLSVSANSQVAPDGTTTAEVATAVSGTGVFPRVYPTTITGTANQTYTASVYAKAGTNNFVQLYATYNSTAGCNFDLSTGTAGTPSACTPAITDVGNGWYRCSITYTPNTTDARIVMVITNSISAGISSDGTWNPTGTETIYLWGLQIEQRSSATAYTPTTGSPITNYIPVLQTAAVNEARLDHDPVTGEAKGLLIEESRTNLITYSDLSINTITGEPSSARLSVITGGGTIAPNGELANTGVGVNTGTSGYVYKYSWSATDGQKALISVFAKKGESNDLADASIRMLFSGNGSGTVQFNLNNGTIVSFGTDCEAFMEDVGNGWYRCSAIITATETVPVLVGMYVYCTTTRTGVPAIPDIHLWGWTVNTNVSFPTSYIPTAGAAVTRGSENCTILPTQFDFNPNYGSVFVTSRTFDDDGGTNYAVKITAIGGYMGIYTQYNGYYRVAVTGGPQGSTNLVLSTGQSDLNLRSTIGFVYNTNRVVADRNGCSTQSTFDVGIPVATEIRIGSYNSSSGHLNGHIESLVIYPKDLETSELEVRVEQH